MPENGRTKDYGRRCAAGSRSLLRALLSIPMSVPVSLSSSVFLAALSLSGCGVANAPPPPPLFLPKDDSIVLSVADTVTLQDVQEQALWMQGVAGLAATHSDSHVIQTYAADIVKSYQAQQKEAEDIAKAVHLSLPSKLDSVDQRRLDNIKKLYRKKYDVRFIQEMSRPMLVGARQRMERAKTQSGVKNIKVLTGKSLDLRQQYARQARHIRRD